MKRLSSLKPRLQLGVSLAMAAAALYALSIALAIGADAKTDKDPAPEKKAEVKVKKLTGAELYAVHCNRCHPERYPTEWTAAQWKTLMTHMRVRANLPVDQAKAILKYLQEDSGTP